MKYLSSDESWPSHPRPQARAALKEAAAAGWYFRKLSNHAFGVLKCPAMGEPGACTIQIYSTSGPFDGSETAKRIHGKLRGCPHQVHDEEEILPGQSDADLELQVEALVQAAIGLQEREKAETAIDRAIEHDVDALDGLDEARVRGDNRSQVAWAHLGRPMDPWPPSVGSGELLAEAENLITMISSGQIVERLQSLVERADS